MTVKKFYSLVYVIYNKRLKDKHMRIRTLNDNIDLLVVEDMPLHDEWLVGQNNLEESGNTLRTNVNDIDINDLYGNDLGSASASAQHPIIMGQGSKRKKSIAKG